jgi:hypothetical protein
MYITTLSHPTIPGLSLPHNFSLHKMSTSTSTTPPVRRFGQYVRLRPSALKEYKEIHAAVWPDVLKQIQECNIRDCACIYRGSRARGG